jgi:type IV pilus assembly protein PilN
LPRFKNVADFVVRMDNLQYLANADLDRAALKRESLPQPAVSFEVASELITLVGESGTEIRLEGGSQDELAGRRGSLRTHEVANMKRPSYGAAGEQYARQTGRGRR